MSSVASNPYEKHPEVVNDFVDFLTDYYREEIVRVAQHYPDVSSLYIEARDLYRYDQDLLDDWRGQPESMESIAATAARNVDIPVQAPDDMAALRVRLTDTNGYLDGRSVASIGASDIGSYVGVSGQMARITGTSPRLETAAFECGRCGTHQHIPQERNSPQTPHECQGCERKGPFSLLDSDSEFVDQRKIKLEEPIEERANARGESVPIYLEGSLCHEAPGDTRLPDHSGERVTVFGIVRVDGSLDGRNADTEMDIWFDARAIAFEQDDSADIDIETHREAFEELAARDDALDLVAESLAPSLQADEGDDLYTARRACAAWLFNAYRLDPADGESKRGDLHMGLFGDPGTGKSTLMRYLHDVCPQSEYRSGTGLSEAGLTSAAVQEEFAGKSEWTLQPGILPRADGGHCLIDEIDGVVDEDTKAMHDALEGEQMVKADKAGIKADIRTRTALAVGGNPRDTRFDRMEPIASQIDIDAALFDRLDIVLALQDQVDEARDEKKASHALDAYDQLSRQHVAEQSEHVMSPDDSTAEPEVSKEVLRAWVAYARRNVFPLLSPAAKETLKAFYIEVRNLNDGYEADEDSVPATMRTLDAGIRIATSLARLRLSETVDDTDAEAAIEIAREMVGLNFNPETGTFDADKQRRDHSDDADPRDTIYELLAGSGGRTESEIVELATDRGHTEAKIRRAFEKLKRAGEVYEPKSDGVFHTT